MAIPGIVGTATGGSSFANVAINVTPPAGAASWLAFLCWDTSAPAVNAPAGWSQVAVHNRDVVRLQVFYADPSTSPGTSWTSTSEYPRALVVVGFDGPVTVVGSTFANSATAPTRTAGSAALIGRVAADLNDSAAALTYPAAATLGRQQLVQWHEWGWAASVAVAFQEQATAGATGTAAFTVPASWMPLAGTLELTVPDAGGPTLESTGLAEVRVVGVGTSRALLTSTGLAELRVAASATSSTVRSVAGGASSTVSVGVATATTRVTAGDGTTATTGVAVTGTVRSSSGTGAAVASADAETVAGVPVSSEGVAAAVVSTGTASTTTRSTSGTAAVSSAASGVSAGVRSGSSSAGVVASAFASSSTLRPVAGVAPAVVSASSSVAGGQSSTGLAAASASASGVSSKLAAVGGVASAASSAIGATSSTRSTTGAAAAVVSTTHAPAGVRATVGTAAVVATGHAVTRAGGVGRNITIHVTAAVPVRLAVAGPATDVAVTGPIVALGRRVTDPARTVISAVGPLHGLVAVGTPAGGPLSIPRAPARRPLAVTDPRT